MRNCPALEFALRHANIFQQYAGVAQLHRVLGNIFAQAILLHRMFDTMPYLRRMGSDTRIKIYDLLIPHLKMCHGRYVSRPYIAWGLQMGWLRVHGEQYLAARAVFAKPAKSYLLFAWTIAEALKVFGIGLSYGYQPDPDPNVGLTKGRPATVLSDEQVALDVVRQLEAALFFNSGGRPSYVYTQLEHTRHNVYTLAWDNKRNSSTCSANLIYSAKAPPNELFGVNPVGRRLPLQLLRAEIATILTYLNQNEGGCPASIRAFARQIGVALKAEDHDLLNDDPRKLLLRYNQLCQLHAWLDELANDLNVQCIRDFLMMYEVASCDSPDGKVRATDARIAAMLWAMEPLMKYLREVVDCANPHEVLVKFCHLLNTMVYRFNREKRVEYNPGNLASKCFSAEGE